MPETPRNILFNEYPSQSIAQYSSLGDRGIVETADGKVFTYDVSRPVGQRFVLEKEVGLHPGMWLPRLGGIQIAIRPAGEYPFTDLEKEIELQARCHTAFRCFTMSLDPEVDVKDRTLLANQATKLIEEDAVYTTVKRALTSMRLWETAVVDHGPKEGKAGELLQAMIAKWRSAEEATSSHLRTWLCSRCGAHGVAEIHPDTPEASLQWMLKDFHSEASPQCDGAAEFDHGSARAALN